MIKLCADIRVDETGVKLFPLSLLFTIMNSKPKVKEDLVKWSILAFTVCLKGDSKTLFCFFIISFHFILFFPFQR